MTTTLPLSRPAALGFDGARLARIDRFLAERYVEPGLLPCALLLVARRGELVHKSVLGHASLANKKRLEEDTIFRIYSMTKPITSIALMMLVEEGLISLDDPVARWLPSWRELTVFRAGQPGTYATRPVDVPMRVIDLMRHTSGLTYGFQNRTNAMPPTAAFASTPSMRRASRRWSTHWRACRSSSRRERRGTTASRPTSSATW
jgi:CubicO group peptidase (beta-lactamase class C family)